MTSILPIEIALPENLENMHLPAPELVNYWRLAENRIFYIDYEIDESVLEIQRSIININAVDKGMDVKDRKKIIIMINSPGGLLNETMSLATSIIMSKTPVVTVNIGEAYSGGFLLLLAGHTRYAFKYAKVMCHTGSGGMQGTFEQTEAAQQMYKKQIDSMGNYILSRTKIDDKVFKRNKSKDWYMDNEECITYGIIEKELDSLDEIV